MLHKLGRCESITGGGRYSSYSQGIHRRQSVLEQIGFASSRLLDSRLSNCRGYKRVADLSPASCIYTFSLSPFGIHSL